MQSRASCTPQASVLNRSPLRLKNQVEFERPVDAKGNIEAWLQRLVDGMQGTVKHVIKRAVNIYVSGPRRARACRSRQRPPRNSAIQLPLALSNLAC
jgi:hypothetical protein